MRLLVAVAASMLIAGGVMAQSPAPLPQYFLAMGGQYDRYASGGPQGAGWVSLSAQVAAKTWSISTIELTPKSSSLRTGVARLLTRNGPWALLAHADGGITTGAVAGATQGVVLGSVSGGAIVLYDLGSWSHRLRGVFAVGVVRVLAINSASVEPIAEIGIGIPL